MTTLFPSITVVLGVLPSISRRNLSGRVTQIFPSFINGSFRIARWSSSRKSACKDALDSFIASILLTKSWVFDWLSDTAWLSDGSTNRSAKVSLLMDKSLQLVLLDRLCNLASKLALKHYTF